MAYKPRFKLNNAFLTDQNGEVKPVQLSVHNPSGPKLYNWVQVFEYGLLRLVEANLSGQELSLALYLIAKCPEDGDVEIDPPLIYFYTGITRTNVSRSVNSLVEAGVLLLLRKYGSRWIYRLNPCLAWKQGAGRYPTGEYIQTEVPPQWQHNPRRKSPEVT